MSAPKPEASSTRWNILTVLPAITLLAIINLFASQALIVSDMQAEGQTTAHSASLPHGHDDATSGPETLPVLGQVQPFALTERSGAPLSQTQLAGKVWVADFIFTSCTAECPLMSAELQKIQTAFASSPELRLVSFTVDPETDTPERLRDYASKYGADPTKWLFATGEREALYQVAIGSFKLPAQDLSEHGHDHAKADHEHTEAQGTDPGHTKNHDPSQAQGHADDHAHPPASAASDAKAPLGTASSSPFIHSQKFVLVDDQLRIRGYYDSTDADALRSLIEKDLPRLLNSL